MSKKDELADIAERIMELYPHLDGVIVEGTTEEPIRIVFMSHDDMIEIAEEVGFEVEDMYDDQGLIEFSPDDDEDGNGGMLQ